MARMKHYLTALVTVGVMLALSACGYENLNSLSLPGNKGVGKDSYTVRIELANALNVVANTPVRVDDVNVGTIRSVDLVDNQPVVTISLGIDVELPENVTAKIGQTSLLGAKHIELIPPPKRKATGALREGSVIPLARSGNYPDTEDVLAATATLLNGGGLSQIKTIATELNRALDGRDGTTRQMLRRTARLASELDDRRGSIVGATESLNRLMAQLADGSDSIDAALDSFPPALRVLAKDRKRLVRALESLGQFGASFSDFVDKGGDNLTRNIEALRPVLRELADAGSSLTDSLWLVAGLAFPIRTMSEYIRGDYLNLWGTVDVGLDTLDRGLLSGTPLFGLLSRSENLLGAEADGQSGSAGNPLEDPLGLAEPDKEAAGADTDSPPDTEVPSGDEETDDQDGIVADLLGSLLMGDKHRSDQQ